MKKRYNPARKDVEGFARHVVNEVSPNELPLFEDLIDEYFENRTPPSISSGDEDDPLAFGPGISMAMVTPAAVAMVSAVLSFIATEVLKVVKAELGEKIQEKTKEVLNSIISRKDKKQPPGISQSQLKDLYNIAFKVAREHGMKKKQAEKMALSLLGEVVIEN